MNANLLTLTTCETCRERPGEFWTTWPPRRLVCGECRPGEECVEDGKLVRQVIVILGRGEPLRVGLARILGGTERCRR